MITRFLTLAYKSCNFLTEDIVDYKGHIRVDRNNILYRRHRIKRVGVVLVEGIILRQLCSSYLFILNSYDDGCTALTLRACQQSVGFYHCHSITNAGGPSDKKRINERLDA